MIQPFAYYSPTRIVFGKGRTAQLSRLIEPHYRTLLVMGGGSTRRNGVYDAVYQVLEGHSVTESRGIKSDPTVETTRKAVQLGRQKQCGFASAAGGGSVTDTNKLVIAMTCNGQDPQDMVYADKHKGEHPPLGVVLAIFAAGLEMSSGGVISRRETQRKHSFSNKHPRFAISDPRVPTSLPPHQVVYGLVDTFAHIIEQYMTAVRSPLLMGRMAKGVLHALIETTPGLMHNHQDVDLMGEFMFCTTVGPSGYFLWDMDQDWSIHYMGYEATALTGLTRGHTLAITPPTMLQVARHLGKQDKFLRYVACIWGFTSRPRQGEEHVITAAIETTKQFPARLSLSAMLRNAEVSHGAIGEVVRRFTERGTVLGEHQNMTPEIVRWILGLTYE